MLTDVMWKEVILEPLRWNLHVRYCRPGNATFPQRSWKSLRIGRESVECRHVPLPDWLGASTKVAFEQRPEPLRRGTFLGFGSARRSDLALKFVEKEPAFAAYFGTHSHSG